MKQRLLTVIALCLMLWSGVACAQTGNGMAMLENPAPDSHQSGVSVISGWACDAEEIARATEDGHWIHYLWPNPAAGRLEEPKHTWAIRHDGLIFGSGYYGPPNFQEYKGNYIQGDPLLR